MTTEKTLLDMLIEDGLLLPPSGDLDDDAASAKMWEAIHGLAAHKIYLMNSDHLSDRQLYEKLLGDILQDPFEPIPDWGTGQLLSVLDIEDDLLDYLTYYADDAARGEWIPDDLPGDLDEPPPRKELPYDRDSQLPSGTIPRGVRKSRS